MTVCIAAMYDKGILAITDMQRTDSVTERSHETPASKIIALTTNTFALIADDMALQGEICEATVRTLTQQFPEGRCQVKEAVRAYNDAYANAKQERILKNILIDYGYRSFDEYLKKPPAASINDAILQRIENFQMPGGIE